MKACGSGKILAALLLGGAISVTVSAPGASAADAAQGKMIYLQKCFSCHGKNGKGDGPMSKSLVPPAANFTDPAGTPRKSDAELLEKIATGGKGTAMPAFKSLNPEQQANVLAYVRTLAGK